jgi:hypothetical protein
MSRKWFESEKEHAARLERLADEAIIAENTGRAPSQGPLESPETFSARVAREADEAVIEKHTGHAPSRHLGEDAAAYSMRIARKANEAIIEKHTGQAPSPRFGEGQGAYSARLAREANKTIVEVTTGHSPSRGVFESNRSWRRRLRREANEATVEKGTRDGHGAGGGGGGVSSGGGSVVVTLIVVGVLVLVYRDLQSCLKRQATPNANETQTPAVAPAAVPEDLDPTPSCGQPGAHPPGSITSDDWRGYRCMDIGQAGARWNSCLDYHEYTTRSQSRCPSQQRCCPGERLPALPQVASTGDENGRFIGLWIGRFSDGQQAKLILEQSSDGAISGSLSYRNEQTSRTIELQGGMRSANLVLDSVEGPRAKFTLGLEPGEASRLSGSLVVANAPARLWTGERIR